MKSTEITIKLKNKTVTTLRTRAREQGVTLTELIERLLTVHALESSWGGRG